MAIAVDATAEGFQGGGSSLTYAHTCTGTDLLLIVGIYSWQDVHTLSATYGGVAMTSLASRAADGTGGLIYLFGLLGPATGANNVVISSTNSNTQIFACSVSYTGVSQSGLPDAVNTNSTATSPYTSTVTTVADNAWLVLVARTPGKAPTASTDTLKRKANAASGDASTLFDSNGARTPAGSQSLVYTTVGDTTVYNAMVSFAPVGATPPVSSGRVDDFMLIR